MKIETVGASDHRFAGALSQLVDSVATERFGRSLLAFMRAHWGIKIVAVYSFRNPGGDTRLLMGAGDVPAALVRTNADEYVGRYAAHDPARRAAMATARSTSAVATCLNRQELPEPGHRDLLEESDVRDRFACFYPGRDERWTSLHAMRSSGWGAISRREFGEMRDFSALFGALLALHLDQTSEAANPLLRLRQQLQCAGPALSARERDVCALLLSGKSSPEIASGLGIGVGSVHTYRKRAYLKLGVSDMREIFMRLLGVH